MRNGLNERTVSYRPKSLNNF